MSTLTIADDTFKQIMLVVGAPFIKEEELEISYNDIKDLIILPALKEYCRWFPIESFYTIDVNGPIDLPFPDAKIFTAKDIRMTTARMRTGATGNPLMDERFIRGSSYYGKNMYGGRFDYGFSSAKISTKFENQSWIDQNRAFKVRAIDSQRVVTGFTNTLGTLEITWASYSNDWGEAVSFTMEGDAIKLAQAFVLDYFGRLRSQDNIPDLPAELNSDSMIERSKELMEEVMTKWKAYAKPVIMRA